MKALQSARLTYLPRNFTWRVWLRQRGAMWAVFALLVLLLIYLLTSGNGTDPIGGMPPLPPLPYGATDSGELSAEAIAALQQVTDAYDPKASVAFVIPVGGRTQRAAQLGAILTTLIDGGAPASNIFVMEDVEGRPGRVNSAPVGEVARAHQVRVVSSHVSRADMPEGAHNFGIHLARHYKFMLDFVLVSPEAAGATGPDAAIDVSAFEFLVIIEDDLVLSPDFVKYFYAMSRVMKVDPTLYCVSAHQDNAFYGTSYEPPKGTVNELDRLGFDFRRGNHFMAPGWMTSKSIYVNTVRPRWLGPDGEYTYKSQLKLRNGHWDRFFDSLIGERDCIFPEIPRITHEGGDGFTVDQRAQMELYSNLKLSQLDVDVDYGDLSRMTRQGYIQAQTDFIDQAHILASFEEARMYRQAKLVYVLTRATSDRDEVWNAVLNGYFGIIGVGGYGGYEGYVKVRGIFRGAVYVRWLTNLVMIIGGYSPYMDQVRAIMQRPARLTLPAYAATQDFQLTSAGCFWDKGQDRDLPYYISYLKTPFLTPRTCLSTCVHLGFRYAGLQNGNECWCGAAYGKHGAASPGAAGCERECDAQAGLHHKGDPLTCGGDWKNSVYYASAREGTGTPASEAALATMHERARATPADVIYVTGQEGQSCQDACQAASTPLRRVQCAEMLFPLIHRHCPLLQELLGCAYCTEEEDIVRGISTPGGVRGAACLLSKGRYIRCAAKPDSQPPGYARACVCQVKGGVGTQVAAAAAGRGQAPPAVPLMPHAQA